MPEKESISEQVQLHHFNSSPPQGATTAISTPSAAALSAAMDRPPPQGYAGLQLPSAFMAYHASPHLQAAAAAAAAAEQRSPHDPNRFFWDPTAFHPSTSHG